MTVAVSGSSGFVGTHLLNACRKSGLTGIPIAHRSEAPATGQLPRADALVHLAAIAHSDAADYSEVIAVNRDLPIEIARCARESGYRHFVFLSSAMVWGSSYDSVHMGTVEKPDTAYGHAKLEAEHALLATSSPDWIVSIIRPPLLYGAGVKGNLAKLLRAVHRWPICPLGVATNRRSLANVENLSEFIVYLIQRGLSGQYAFQDEDPVSTFEVLKRMATHMPYHGRIVPTPRWMQNIVHSIAPRAARRMFGSFVVEDSSVVQTGFVPQSTMEDGFRKMVRTYLGFDM